jgi:hypothetical protein
MFLTKELTRQKVSGSGKERKDGGEIKRWQQRRRLLKRRPQRKRRSNYSKGT